MIYRSTFVFIYFVQREMNKEEIDDSILLIFTKEAL